MSERERLVQAVFNVLAPEVDYGPPVGRKTSPIFEWGHETTPTDDEVRELAGQIVDAILGEQADGSSDARS
jgi:hypothetical protein